MKDSSSSRQDANQGFPFWRRTHQSLLALSYYLLSLMAGTTLNVLLGSLLRERLRVEIRNGVIAFHDVSVNVDVVGRLMLRQSLYVVPLMSLRRPGCRITDCVVAQIVPSVYLLGI